MDNSNKKPQINYKKGITLGLLASFSLAIMGVFVHAAGTRLPNSELLFARFFISLIIILPFVVKNKNFSYKVNKPWLLILRCLLGFSSMVLLFYNLQKMDLAHAVLFLNTGPIFVPIIVWLFLGIKTSKWVILSILFSLCGVAVILNPSSKFPILFGIFGILNGISAGGSFVVIRQLCNVNNPKQLLFYFFLFGTIISLISAPFSWLMPSFHELWMLLFIGLTGMVFQYFITNSLMYLPSRVMTPLLFTEVIFAGIFGWVFWQQTIDNLFILGSLMIVLGVTAIMLLKPTESKNAKSTNLSQP
jgi:drug/metabolite transporter (DMT)-like permease